MKPNVVFIIMDDLCWGDLACHGNPHTRTPNLDKMHKESVRLNRYCTGPLCSPARASVMTGRYHMRTRVVDTYLGRSMIEPEEATLAQVMHNAGYRTGAFGKWHLGDTYPMRAIDLGFEEALMHNGGGIGQPGDHIANYLRPQDCYFNPVLFRNGVPETSEGYCTDIFTDAAIDFVERNQHEPFFAYLATNAPHSPLIVADEWADTYRKMGINDTHSRLYGMVENIDWNMGRLFAKLEELKLSDNTIVVYTSDHGPCPSARDLTAPPGKQDRFNAGLRGIKGTMYNGGIQVPCFWKFPGFFEAGKDVGKIASPVDVMPTLSSVCGFDMPKNVKIDGLDLSPLLRGEADEKDWTDRSVFMQWHRGDEPIRYRNYAVISDKFKLHRGREGDPDELYDMQDDLLEKNDIAADSRGTVEEMREKYNEWFDNVSATRPDNYAPPKIFFGTDFENPTVLTRQDWRIHGEDGWSNKDFGHWETFAAQTAAYDITMKFTRKESRDAFWAETAQKEGAGQAFLMIDDKEYRLDIDADSYEVVFEKIELSKGSHRVEGGWQNGRSLIAPFQIFIENSCQGLEDAKRKKDN